jgi:hypothetical protein
MSREKERELIFVLRSKENVLELKFYSYQWKAVYKSIEKT